MPDSVSVRIKMRRIIIQFRKRVSSEWPRLGSEKWSWIQFDFESSNFDIEENNNSELPVTRYPLTNVKSYDVDDSDLDTDSVDEDLDNEGDKESSIESDEEGDPTLDAEEFDSEIHPEHS